MNLQVTIEARVVRVLSHGEYSEYSEYPPSEGESRRPESPLARLLGSSATRPGNELSTRMTRRQRMRTHTWELCGKRSILAFLNRIDKVHHRVLKL